MKLAVLALFATTVQAVTIPFNGRFSSLRGALELVEGEGVGADGDAWDDNMKKNVEQATTLISFAANRVDYKTALASGKTDQDRPPLKCIKITDLEAKTPGITASYVLTNPKYKINSKKPDEAPGLDQIGHKCIGCGLANAIFFREYLMKNYKNKNLLPKGPGTGGHPTVFYLDFLTMKNASPLHTHPKWKEAWDKAALGAKRQIFLVDDAFMVSPNCLKEVQTWKEQTGTKQPQAFVILGGDRKFFKRTKAVASLAKIKTLFGDKVAKYYKPKDGTDYIPAAVLGPLKSQCAASLTDKA